MIDTPTTVFNMATGEELVYFTSPRMAVICAYAQHKFEMQKGLTGDYNTWMYEASYGPWVEETPHTYLLGDWTALKDISKNYRQQLLIKVEKDG